jgi:CubicO group peptidase (beta-lactamase class C family)
MAGLATDFMNAYNVPGLSVAIATKGKPVYVEAFGVADRESGEALTPQHRFRAEFRSRRRLSDVAYFAEFDEG